jgi:hypothetical protein
MATGEGGSPDNGGSGCTGNGPPPPAVIREISEIQVAYILKNLPDHPAR